MCADKIVPRLELAVSDRWKDYELLDSGGGSKLERFGPVVAVRPDAKTFWKRSLKDEAWDRAQAVFEEGAGESGSHWTPKSIVDRRWTMEYEGLKFYVQPTPFRHMGFFPEQANHWDWMRRILSGAGRETKVLNLYGYTGLATLAAASAGAAVTHIDASKKSITWARENQTLSGLGERPIRWIPEDALKFVEREGRRGSKYDGIIIDPPKFGRGPNGEIWKLEDSLGELIEACRNILSERPLFVVLTVYAANISPLSAYYLLQDLLGERGGALTAGELVLPEKSGGRMLPAAIFARWSA
jgi:23S rRNA (cytosine1962-C5)-methyltransferase